MRYSLPPGNDLMVQHTAPSSGTYLHWPGEVNNKVQSLGTADIKSQVLWSSQIFRTVFTWPRPGLALDWALGLETFSPIVVLNLGESASLGTGIMISTLLAVDLRLNWDLAFTMISTLRPIRGEHPGLDQSEASIILGSTNHSSPGVGVALYAGLDPDQRLHVSVQSGNGDILAPTIFRTRTYIIKHSKCYGWKDVWT